MSNHAQNRRCSKAARSRYESSSMARVSLKFRLHFATPLVARSWLVAFLFLLWAPEALLAGQGGVQGGRGGDGITESVKDIMSRNGSNGPAQPPQSKPIQANHNQRLDNPGSPRVPQWPVPGNSGVVISPSSLSDPESESVNVASIKTPDVPLVLDAQTLGTNFLGPTLADSGWFPPNAIGAVGPSQILVVVNGRIRSYNRSGVADGAIDTDTNNFFSSVRNGANTSDSRVVFDFLSQRWFVSMLNMQTAPNRLLLAVSSSGTITSSSSFTFYQFTQNVPPIGTGSPGSATIDNGLFADYPSLGVDNNAVYMGVNMFTADLSTYQGATAFVINKASLLTGTLTVT